MKKYITYITMEPEEHLKKLHYSPKDASLMEQYEERNKDGHLDDLYVHFPIAALIGYTIDEGDEIEIIYMLQEENEKANRNLEILKNEVKMITEEKNASFTMKEIMVSKTESAQTYLSIFGNVIDKIKDDDILYACLTYGTKPIVVVEMLILQYAHKIKNNVSVKNIVYGSYFGSKKERTDECDLFDVKSLFYMQQIVNQLADRGVTEPEKILKSILGVED